MSLMGLRSGLSAVFLACACGTVALLACSDDELGPGASGGDAGSDVAPPTPTPRPPPNDPPEEPPPPDGVDRTGFLGEAQLIADVGEPTDGPSWHAVEGALYFAVPGSATPLRALVPGGPVTAAAYDDAGASRPVGTASNGGSALLLTEGNALAVRDVDDAGAVTVSRRIAPLGAVLGDIAAVDGGSSAFFVDTTSMRAFRYDAPSDVSLALDEADAGRATGIAASIDSVGAKLWVAANGVPFTGTAVFVYEQQLGGGFLQVGAIDLNGTPPNAIAVDDGGFLYVAWARGIDVYTNAGKLSGPSPGLPLAAAPTSLAFGGADRRTLFVTTAAGKIYAVPTNRPGVLR